MTHSSRQNRPRARFKVAQNHRRTEISYRGSGRTPGLRGLRVVAPTGVDPVTFRFSVERSTN